MPPHVSFNFYLQPLEAVKRFRTSKYKGGVTLGHLFDGVVLPLHLAVRKAVPHASISYWKTFRSCGTLTSVYQYCNVDDEDSGGMLGEGPFTYEEWKCPKDPSLLDMDALDRETTNFPALVNIFTYLQR